MPNEDGRIDNFSSRDDGTAGCFEPDHIVVGKYRVQQVIGQGGMATVYRVEHIFLQKTFALKTMLRHSGSDVLLRRFYRESSALSALSHPNIVQVHDFGLLEDDQPYLVMDLIEGVTFADLLKEQGPLPFNDIAPLVSQVCFGLLAAHEQGIVHRDIKPGNIMLTERNVESLTTSAKLVDFGIAKIMSDQDNEHQALTRTGEIFGSPLYMSPEQCTGGNVDARSDIYSLGCVIFELLTGTPPHVGASPFATMSLHISSPTPSLKEASLGKNFPASVEAILSRMLQKNPADRYQNIGVVAHELAVARNNGDPIGLALRAHGKQNHLIIKPTIEPLVISRIAFSAILLLTALITAFVVLFFEHTPLKLSKKDNESTASTSPISNTTSIKNNVQVARTDREIGQQFDDDEEPAIAERDLFKAQPATSMVVEKDGQKFRKFSFPKAKIAEIYDYRPMHSPRGICAAKNVVSIEADRKLGLILGGRDSGSQIALRNVYLFSKLQPDDFSGLVVLNKGGGDLQQLLAAIKNWHGLETMSLIGAVNCDKALPLVNEFKNLRYFELLDCSVKHPASANQPFFSQLKTITLRAVDKETLKQIFLHFNAKSTLKGLILDKNDLAGVSFLPLKSCQTLRYVRLNACSFDDLVVTQLAGLHQIDTLVFVNSKISLSHAQAIAGATNVKDVQLSETSFSSVEKMKISKLSPKFRFIKMQ